MTIAELTERLQGIYQQILKQEGTASQISAQAHSQYRLSAKNLYRYLLLRSSDLRDVHDSLSDLGLSSMRTSEGYVYASISNVLRLLRLLEGQQWTENKQVETIGYQGSKKLLQKHANELFNEEYDKHLTEIMVTLSDEMAEDKEWLKRLALEGMQIARINLSHGDLELWTKMINNVHQLREELGLPIKIYMDLSGPKIRTSAISIQGKKGKSKDFVRLKEGDHLVLTKRETLGKSAAFGPNEEKLHAAEVGVLLPQIIDDVQVNDTVFFDDGMIKGTVISKNDTEVELVITKAYKSKLSSQKGINLPNTNLKLPALTERDIELLPFVCANADIIGYSFVRRAEDVQKLYRELEKHQNAEIGVVFKIENKEAFDNLPLILFEAMKRPKIGVMIARGDLAVEIGYERISEVQNQILWLCEAAHVPVIWATQVLETLAKTGIATRAEVSDAVMSAQAECVMLNKGPFIVDAVRTLKDIIEKMGHHASKKKSTSRMLKVAENALEKIHAERADD
jgi:pyruvate kinase